MGEKPRPMFDDDRSMLHRVADKISGLGGQGKKMNEGLKEAQRERDAELAEHRARQAGIESGEISEITAKPEQPSVEQAEEKEAA